MRLRIAQISLPALLLGKTRPKNWPFRTSGAILCASQDPPHAGVAELVDAPDSKSGSGNRVRVRVSPPAPYLTQDHNRA